MNGGGGLISHEEGSDFASGNEVWDFVIGIRACGLGMCCC